MNNLLVSSDFKEFLNSCKTNSNVVAVILFGSYARNTQKKSSDIDLCIVRKNSYLIKDFDFPLRDENFDVHFFDTLPEIIKFRIIGEGKLVVLNNEVEYNLIKRKFLREYMGFSNKRDYYRGKLLENVY